MAGLAQLQARMKAMQAEEMSAAQPGRMSEIRNKTAIAQDDEAGMGDTLKARGMARQNKIGDEDIKSIRNELKKLEPLLNAYDGAKSPEEKSAVQEMARMQGAKFGKLDLGAMNPQQFDIHMKALRHAQTNGEKFNLEEMKQEGATERKGIEMEGRRDIAAEKAKVAMALKRLGITNAAEQKSTLEKIKAKYARGEKLNPYEQELLDFEGRKALYATEMRGAAIKGDMEIQPGGKVGRAQPNLPSPPAINPNPAGEEAPAAPAASEPVKTGPTEADIPAMAQKMKWPSGEQGYNPKKYVYRINNGKLERKLK
jgi:hypothetical protein